MDKPNCQGHEGKCPFCKSEHGSVRYMNGAVQMERVPGNPTKWRPIVDFCCHQCKSNFKSESRQYVKTSLR